MRPQILLPFLAALHGSSLCAQAPVLDFGDAPQPGMITAYTVYVGDFALFSTGEMQTWDLSDLTATGTNTLSYLPPTVTPFGASLPDATVAVDQGDGTYAFFRADATGLYRVGYEMEPYYLDWSDPIMYYPFPCTYGTSFTDTYAFAGVNFSGPVNQSGEYGPVTMDGWGTLILPNGTLENVLKRHHEIHQVAYTGTQISSEMILYYDYFLHPGAPWFAAFVYQTAHWVDGQLVATTRDVRAISDITQTVPEQGAEPALQVRSHGNGVFTLMLRAQEDIELRVMDMAGRLVHERTVRAVPGQVTPVPLDLQGEAPGPYLLHVLGTTMHASTRLMLER